MSLTPAESCPLCDSSDTRLLFRKAGIPCAVCRDCGFRFSKPQANINFQPSIEQYEDAYLQYLGSDPADQRNFEAACQRIESHTVLRGARLLDVGCGGGKWVRHLRGMGVAATGIEPSVPLYQHFLASESCFRNTTLDDPILDAQGPFDVITAFDVLEHVVDPRSLLRRATALLKNGGWFFVSLPDAGSLTARMMRKHWHHWNRYHFSFFDRVTLTRTARSLGLELASFSRRGCYRSLGYVLRYGFEFLVGRKSPGLLARFDDWHFPLNLYDTMYVAFQKASPGKPAPS